MKHFPKIHCAKVIDYLLEFIQNQTQKNGFSKVIVGLSGGIDSSVVAYLAVKALGFKYVLGYFLPYTATSKESKKHVDLIANKLNIILQTIDISPQLDIYFKNQKTMDLIRKGNKMARERMSILFDQAKAKSALVIGTSNKTESLLGYSTWFGDTACSFNPIGDLYKTQIREIALYLKVPSEIIKKTPSADLWKGQTDEGEIGYTYEQMDAFLYHSVDLGKTKSKLLKMGFHKKMITDLSSRIEKNKFKTKLPPIAILKGNFY